MHVDAPTGRAHESHFTVSMRGSALQQEAQTEAVRSRHGSSAPQATHHDGRTIRSASRPTNDNALARLLDTRTLYSVTGRSGL